MHAVTHILFWFGVLDSIVLPLHVIYIHIKLHLCVSCPYSGNHSFDVSQSMLSGGEDYVSLLQGCLLSGQQEWHTVWHVKPFKECVTSHPEHPVYVPTHYAVWRWGGYSWTHNKGGSTHAHAHKHTYTCTQTQMYTRAHTTGAANYITDVTEAIRHSTQTNTYRTLAPMCIIQHFKCTYWPMKKHSYHMYCHGNRWIAMATWYRHIHWRNSVSQHFQCKS